MIEINLLPGSVKRTKRKIGGGGLSAGPLAKIKLPTMDKYMLIAIGMWVVGLGLIVYMQVSGSSRLKEARNTMEVLQRDTARLSGLLAQNRELVGKRDTIAAKLQVIQELDAGRYDWAHILDEVSRAVPDYTWLTSITPSADNTANTPGIRIEGRMGNSFALPKFMIELENSPFLANVTLKGSASLVENQKSIYSFIVEAVYEEPPADMIRTEPLFGPDMQPDSAISAIMGAKADAKSDAAAAANAPAGAAKPGAKPAPNGAPGKTPAAPAAKPPVKKAGN
jgi:Tfp pilus assembly protein PilN